MMNGFKTFVKQTASFTARNIRMFFKDKGTLISALISPLVILGLYILFLDGVLKDSFTSNIGDLVVDAKLINGYIASYEVSSILATCTVTVAFVANMAMVNDKVSGVRTDLLITPVKKSVLTLGYYFATAIVTLAICYVTTGVGLIYIAASGWGMSGAQVAAVFLDVLLSSLFGTALSSVVCNFLRSRGAINAVSTIVSTVYGFICGAYYPISQFGKGIADVVMCLPGTYFTGLLRTHFMTGYFDKFVAAGFPTAAAEGVLDTLDAKMYFFGSAVPAWVMYLVAVGAVVLLVGLYVLINVIHKRKKTKKSVA